MAPGGLVEVRVSWPGHSRYLKKKKKEKKKSAILNAFEYDCIQFINTQVKFLAKKFCTLIQLSHRNIERECSELM